MKKVFKFGCLFILGILILSLLFGSIATCSNKDWAKEVDSLSQDSLESPAKIAAKPKINTDSVVKVFRSDFIFKKDEFGDRIWVEPKNRPQYTNVNRIYTYFELDDSIARNFRFRIQYTADDWLFIQKITFNIDGNRNIVFVPEKMERDNDSSIWEWCDEPINTQYEFLISALAKAKKAKVKFDGQQYYDTRTITDNELKYIRKTYEFYLALGGKF